MKLKMFDDDTIKMILDDTGEVFQDYWNQRDDIDEGYELSDWMYKCGTHRGTFNKERRKWIPAIDEEKSNLGSGLAHRQVNTLAGILGSILLSGRDLWRYNEPRMKGSTEEPGAYTAEAMNTITRWIQKMDGFDQKIPEFCVSVFKHSNIFALFGMRQVKYDTTVSRLTMEEKGAATDEEGEEIEGLVDVEITRDVKVETKYTQIPSVTFPYPRNIYLDKHIASIEDQDCVIILSLTTRKALMSEGKFLDQKLLAKTPNSDLAWDGNFGSEGKKSDAEHLGRDADIGEGTKSRLMLRWDIYQYLPMRKGKYVSEDDIGEEDEDEEVEGVLDMKLMWTVCVGNTLSDAICLKMVSSQHFAPDGKIPIKEIRAIPDSSDVLYHTCFSEITRPMYAADCTMMNAACDGTGLAIDPPMSVRMGRHKATDFRVKSGVRWDVKDHDDIRQWLPKDNMQQLISLREQIRDDMKLVMATDQARLGEYAGARTSAFEVSKVTSSTDTTIAIRNAYIVGQILPWLADKYLTYCREFIDPTIVTQILGETIPTRPMGGYVGDYDVTVDIVGEYEDEMQRRTEMNNVMQVLTNPAYLRSETHEINVGELVKEFLEVNRFSVGKIVTAPMSGDSEANARQRIARMMETGEYIPPKPGENHAVHMHLALSEMRRWAGVTADKDPRVANAAVLKQYVAALKEAMEAPQQGMPQGQPEQEMMNEGMAPAMGGEALQMPPMG